MQNHFSTGYRRSPSSGSPSFCGGSLFFDLTGLPSVVKNNWNVSNWNQVKLLVLPYICRSGHARSEPC